MRWNLDERSIASELRPWQILTVCSVPRCKRLEAAALIIARQKSCHDNLMYDSVLWFGIARYNQIVGEAVQELPSYALCQTNESQDDGVASNCRRVFVVNSP